jgi:hypothetical protein
MPRQFASQHPPIRRPPRALSATVAHGISGSDDTLIPDDDPDESWDDFDPNEELQPFDDPDLEIEAEPDPDDRDFWLDPDETEDPWN